jgi:hypothetical protein
MPEKIISDELLALAKEKNIPSDFLKPEEYLFYTLFFPPEIHDALVEQTVIQPTDILSREQVIDDVRRSVAENDITFMGVDHASYRDHEAIAHILAKEDLEDTAIAIEFSPRFQEKIDLFLSTGRFNENDDPKQYTKVYKDIMRTSHFNAESIDQLKGTPFEELLDLEQIYPILLVARAKGLPVRCFDRRGELDDNRTQESEDEMLSSLLAMKQKKLIVIAGGFHGKKGTYKDDQNEIVSLRTLCEKKGKKTKSYWFDSKQAGIRYSWMTNEVTETVLHAAVMKKALSVGRKSNLVGYKNDVVNKMSGADVYVAVS